MKIIGTNEEEQKQKKNKKIFIGIGVTIGILFVISIILLVLIVMLQQKMFKLNIDGKSISKFSEDAFIIDNNKMYVSIRDFAALVNYDVYNGGYKEYSEVEDKCYVQNVNEIAAFSLDSDKIYKTSTGDVNDYQYFNLEEPVKKMNNKLYVLAEGISVACNVSISYNAEKNSVKIYTLPYLTQYYSAKIPNSAILEDFENQKALKYNMMVVNNVKSNVNMSKDKIRYGVVTLDGKEIIGTKYTDIEFIESTNEFLVTTEDKKVGIIKADGQTKVAPQYDELKQIDKDLNLYLAKSGNKKGVLENNGKILIYLEYDEIGIDISQFANNDIKNPYLLLGNCIPVKQNGKWGMFDIRGNLIVPIIYTGFGSNAKSIKDKVANNVLVIPEVDGIVVYQENKEARTAYYGIINTEGKELVPIALDTLYSVTTNGKNSYTMTNNGNTYDIIEYIQRYVYNNNTDNSKTNEQAGNVANTQNSQANAQTQNTTNTNN